MLVYRVACSALARYSPGQMANPKEENEETPGFFNGLRIPGD
jgi:hypothetical protein